MSLLIRGARVLTMGGSPGHRRGPALRELGVIARADVLIEHGTVARIEAPGRLSLAGATESIDAAGRVLMPGYVDCHTHSCWAGERLDEWEMKRRGVPYLEILKAGGGIMATVRAVRAASEEELERLLRARLAWMLRMGTTTVEVKSGYGLEATNELKMLRVIRAAGAWAARQFGMTVVPTALLGHAIDPAVEHAEFVRTTIEETLPAVSREFPGITIDAFCEKGAWSLEECLALFERAKSLEHPVRVHADQFNSLGMTVEAARRGFVSVDHLEASTSEVIDVLASSNTAGVILPACGFHLDGRYANARRLVDAGGAVALATNLNPGSAPCGSMPMAVALAVRHCGLEPAEAITGCTVNGAAVLGLDDRGFIAPGARADLVLMRHEDERGLAYEFGGNPVETVICGGRLVHATAC